MLGIFLIYKRFLSAPVNDKNKLSEYPLFWGVCGEVCGDVVAVAVVGEEAHWASFPDSQLPERKLSTLEPLYDV